MYQTEKKKLCSTTFPDTKKRVENMMYGGVFLTGNLEVFGNKVFSASYA